MEPTPVAQPEISTLDELLARLASNEAISGILLMGTTGTAALTPTSDYDLLLVLAALPAPLRMVTTWVEARMTEVYCTTDQTVERVATSPAIWAGGSEEGILVNWLRDGHVIHDPHGRLMNAQDRLRQGPPPMMATDDEVYEAKRRIFYNLAQLDRYLAADDPVSRVVVDLRLLYSLFEVAFHYFTVRRLPWRGEKQAVRYWTDHDAEYLDILRRCFTEQNRLNKVRFYEELAQRTLEPVGGLWPSDSTVVAIGPAWGAESEGGPIGTVGDALGFWQRLIDGQES